MNSGPIVFLASLTGSLLFSTVFVVVAFKANLDWWIIAANACCFGTAVDWWKMTIRVWRRKE
jgi:hypothetical protein